MRASIAGPILISLTACHAEPMPRLVEQAGREQAAAAGDLRPLGEKAALLQRTLEAHHLTPEGLYAYRVPWPYADEPPQAVYSDTVGWTALLAVSQCLRYEVGGDPAAAALRDRVLRGLSHLARVTGVHGVLARTMIPDDGRPLEQGSDPRRWERGAGEHAGLDYSRYLWKTDLAKCMVASWYLALQFGIPQVEDESLRADLVADLAAVTERIVEADYRLTDTDGRAVRFNDLHPGGRGPLSWILRACMASPVDLLPGFDLAIGTNAMLCLGLTRAHDAQVADGRHAEDLVARGWDEAMRDGVYSVLGFSHYGNDHLAAVCGWLLLETAPDAELRDDAARGLWSLWRRHQNDRCPLHTLLALKAGVVAAADVDRRLRELCYSLQVYPLDRRLGPVDHRGLAGVLRRPLEPDEARHAMPLNLQPSSSVFWKSDPTRIFRQEERDEVHAGMDYLLVWWWLQALVRDGTLTPAALDRAGLPLDGVDEPDPGAGR